MRTLLLGLCFVSSLCFADQFEAKHVAPSTILAHVSGAASGRMWSYEGTGAGIIPKGIKLRANDNRGVIEVDGPADASKQTLETLAIFDVAPQQVMLKLQAQNRYRTSSTEATLSNNSAWTLDDEQVGVALNLTPRINSDGTITVKFAVKNASGESQRLVFRLKDGETYKLTLQGGTLALVQEGQNQTKSDLLEAPVDVEITCTRSK